MDFIHSYLYSVLSGLLFGLHDFSEWIQSYIFDIQTGKSLTMDNVSLIGGSGPDQTRVISNKGNLQMTDVDILDIPAAMGKGKTIANEGIMTTFGNTRIRPQ